MPERTTKDFLIRLDERTVNIWRVVEKMEQHQAEQNGLISESIQSSQRNTTWRKVICCVGGGWLLMITALIINLLVGG